MEPDSPAARWTRIKALFHAASELPEPERAALLAREADAGIAREVRELLQAHDAAGEFPRPIPEHARTAAIGGADSIRPGEHLGPWRIVELIGSGGMGDVFRAVRDDDQYRAEVAVKIMRADMPGAVAEQRFRTERQILASLDHRNIARLLDGGTTPRGLPYVVMELVAGEPIDVHCDARGLDVRERVRLFRQVCAAVSYAHQHLVVHRDLKPGNILVTADGSVKLLDFGIAKLLEPDPQTGAPAEQTRTQLRVMTLEYASPEQVAGGTVTTASDVYSLGVVLYRLLTGHSPYRVGSGEVARVAEILSDATPTRPSQLETRTRQPVDADLDHILLMALRKEPARRYGSVEQFAEDLRRYLEGMPVEARRGSLVYRTGKFVKRNKVAIAAGVVATGSLLTGLGMARHEASVARQQREVAQRNFERTRQLANALMFDIHDELVDLSGGLKAREKLLRTAEQYLNELSGDSAGGGELPVELATAYVKLGDAQGQIFSTGAGNTALALQSYARAVQLAERAVKVDPVDGRARVVLASALKSQAYALLGTDEGTKALGLALRAVELGESTPRESYLDDLERARSMSNAYMVLANVQKSAGRSAEAVTTFGKMIAIAEQYASDHPDSVKGLEMRRNAYNNASLVSDDSVPPQQSIDRSIDLLSRSLEVTGKLLALEPGNPAHLRTQGVQRRNLGDALFYARRYREALEQFRLASAALGKSAEGNDDAQVRREWVLADIGQGAALVKLGEVGAAGPPLARAEPTLRALFAKDPGDVGMLYARAWLAISRGQIHARRREWSQAATLLRTGVKEMRQVNALYELTGGDKAVMDDGIASLAEAEARAAAH